MFQSNTPSGSCISVLRYISRNNLKTAYSSTGFLKASRTPNVWRFQGSVRLSYYSYVTTSNRRCFLFSVGWYLNSLKYLRLKSWLILLLYLNLTHEFYRFQWHEIMKHYVKEWNERLLLINKTYRMNNE